MTSVLSTVADALIEFILSLLRDPSALQEFEEDPEGMLERHGLEGVGLAHVQAVKPVVVDHPSVVHTSSPQLAGGFGNGNGPQQSAPQHLSGQDGGPGHGGPHYGGPQNAGDHPLPAAAPASPVVREINSITQSFHFDNRATVVDQSVNQNIWAEGDVTQIFDQEAIIAAGDEANAAGRDVDHSQTDIATGDIAIGNTDTAVSIDGSFNEETTSTDTDVDATAHDSFNDTSAEATVGVNVSDSFNDSSESVDLNGDVESSYNDGSVNAQATTEISDSFNSGESSSSTVTDTSTVVVNDSAEDAAISDDSYDASNLDSEVYDDPAVDEF